MKVRAVGESPTKDKNIHFFSKCLPTCHLLSSEGTRIADGEGALRSPSIIHRAHQGHQHSRDRLQHCTEGIMPGQLTKMARTHSTASSVVGINGQDSGCCLSHRWQQTGDQTRCCGSGQTAEQL